MFGEACCEWYYNGSVLFVVDIAIHYYGGCSDQHWQLDLEGYPMVMVRCSRLDSIGFVMVLLVNNDECRYDYLFIYTCGMWQLYWGFSLFFSLF